MNPKYELYEQIDRYLNNSMNKEEYSRFVELLSQDEELLETVEAQRLANDLVIDEELIQLKSRMQLEMNGGNSGISGRAKILIASLVVLSIAAATYLFSRTDSTSSENTVANENGTTIGNNTGSNAVESTAVETNISKNKSKNTIAVISTESSSENNITEQPETDHKTTDNTSNNTTSETDRETTAIATNKTEKNTTLENKQDVINCDRLTLDAQTRVLYENNNTEATIVVDGKSIQGGKAPYQFSLDKETFTTENRFENVQEGNYHIFIKDQSNCIVQLAKVVTVKFPEIEINDAFTPGNGERWAFPLNGNSDASIVIQNKAGQIVYAKKIQGGQPSDWDGRDLNGNDLSSGNYYFIITFTNAKMQKGHISIFR